MSVGIPELQVLGVLIQTLFLLWTSTNGFHTKRSLFGSTTLFSTQVQSRKAILKLVGKLIKSITGTKTASSGLSEESSKTLCFWQTRLSWKTFCCRSLLCWHIWIFHSSWYFVEESLRQTILVTSGTWWLKKDVPEISTLGHSVGLSRCITPRKLLRKEETMLRALQDWLLLPTIQSCGFGALLTNSLKERYRRSICIYL